MICQALSHILPSTDTDESLLATVKDQLALLATPPGIAWSGRTRYAAAMALYAAVLMDAGTLEIFRTLSRLDNEDPLSALARLGGDPRWQQAIRAARAG